MDATPTRPVVLAVLYPAFGHVLPALPVLAELVASGCRVVATTGPGFADRVAATGAEVVTYRTALTDAAPPVGIDADEMARRTLEHVCETLAVAPVVAGCGRPDVVVHDPTLWAPGRVLAAGWGVPAVQLAPTFASNEHFSVGERLARIAPPVDPSHPDLVRCSRRLAEFAAEHGVPEDRVPAVLGGADALTVVTIPRGFQVHGDTFGDDHLFVGYSPVPGGPPTWTPPDSGEPVVLVSLGTTVNDDPAVFRACVAAVEGTGRHAVLTVGSRIAIEDVGPLPAGVEVHRWIALGDVLRHAAVFVCQGGMGSVQESLHHAVPMVVVPHHHEQQANAERIVELGLGAVLPPAELDTGLNTRALRDAVDHVASDPDVRARVRSMSEHSRASGGARAAARAIVERAGLVATAR